MGGKHSKNTQPPEFFADLNSRYTAEEVQQWYERFMSTHPYKVITREEFVVAYLQYFPNGKASVFAENVFRLFDGNKDGRIDFRELAVALSIASRGTQIEKLRMMFSLYDVNGDGFVKKYEMRKILKSIITMVTKQKDLESLGSVVEEHLTKIYEELDKDSDGSLSLLEFTQVVNTSTVFMDIFEKGVAKAPK